jgi:hypothetical protein
MKEMIFGIFFNFRDIQMILEILSWIFTGFWEYMIYMLIVIADLIVTILMHLYDRFESFSVVIVLAVWLLYVFGFLSATICFFFNVSLHSCV